MEIVLWTLLPLLLLAVAAGTWVLAIRQRRHYNAHPEQRPSGKRLLARMAPLIVISLAGCLGGVLLNDPVVTVLCGLAAAALTWEVWRRREHPAGAHPPRQGE